LKDLDSDESNQDNPKLISGDSGARGKRQENPRDRLPLPCPTEGKPTQFNCKALPRQGRLRPAEGRSSEVPSFAQRLVPRRQGAALPEPREAGGRIRPRATLTWTAAMRKGFYRYDTLARALEARQVAPCIEPASATESHMSTSGVISGVGDNSSSQRAAASMSISAFPFWVGMLLN